MKQYARHLLECLPEDIAALEASCALLVRIRAHFLASTLEFQITGKAEKSTGCARR
jgi:hypothetical protein